MKELMKNDLVLSLGAGVLAFVAVTFVLKQMDKNKEKSNVAGLGGKSAKIIGCASGTTWCRNSQSCTTPYQCF